MGMNENTALGQYTYYLLYKLVRGNLVDLKSQKYLNVLLLAFYNEFMRTIVTGKHF